MCFFLFLSLPYFFLSIMSRSHRHPSSSSRGHSTSSDADRSLTATTSSLQGLHLTETTSEQYLYPSTARSASRSSPYDSTSASGPSAYQASPFGTVNPADLSNRNTSSSYGQSTYSYDDTAANMKFVVLTLPHFAFLTDVTLAINHTQQTRCGPRTEGQLIMADLRRKLVRLDLSFHSPPPPFPRSLCGLKSAGYPMPSTDPPLSRSMSGPQVPTILPSSSYYEEVRHIGREFARQRRRLTKPRRERKITYRQAVLPSNTSAGSSQAEDMSRSIDSFTAQSASSYENSLYAGMQPYPTVTR